MRCEGTANYTGKNKEAREASLGTGSAGKLLFQLALPTIAAQIASVLYNMVDRMYISHPPDEGAHVSIGVGVAFPAIMAISAFATLVNMGGAPRASIMLGKGRKEEAENILGNCTTALITVAVAPVAFLFVFGRSILLMSRASNNTTEYGWAYMQIYPPGIVFVQLALGPNALIGARGYVGTDVYIVSIRAICNIILDPIPMFVFHMGVRDVALTTIISQRIPVVWAVLFLISNKNCLETRAYYMRPKREILMSAIALGTAPFVMQLMESILNICFNTSPLKYGGDVAVGAMTIMGSVMQFSLLSLQELTQGAQSTISFNYSAKKLDRVNRTSRLLLTPCSIYSTVLWAMTMFVLTVYIRIFTHDAALIDFSKWSIRIYTAVPLFFGAQLTCQQTFITIGDGKTSLLLALLRKVILLVPLTYILPNIFENKMFAVFVTEPIADTIVVYTTATLFILTFRKMKRKLGAHA